MTTRPAPTPPTATTVYRLRLDNLLLALVLCGLVAAAVPMIYASVQHRMHAQPARLPVQATATAPLQSSAAASAATANLTPAQAVASATALLARGQFAAAMQLVANLSGPAADAADASGMRNRISAAQETFAADLATIEQATTTGDWTAVTDAAREARTLAPLPADAAALATRASAELIHATALGAAQTALQEHRYADALKLARDGFARWKTTDFRDLMVTSLAGIASTGKAAATTTAASPGTGLTHSAGTPGTTGTGTGTRATVTGGGSVTTASGTISHLQHNTANTTRPAAAFATTGQETPSTAFTASSLANDPAFAGVDPQLLADALRLLGPNGLAQLQAAGMKFG